MHDPISHSSVYTGAFALSSCQAPSMEGDVSPKEEEDPIVREIDVYLSMDLKDSL